VLPLAVTLPPSLSILATVVTTTVTTTTITTIITSKQNAGGGFTEVLSLFVLLLLR
jgi:hypothetical protein